VSLEAGTGLCEGFWGTVRSCVFVFAPVVLRFLAAAHGDHSGRAAMGASPALPPGPPLASALSHSSVKRLFLMP